MNDDLMTIRTMCETFDVTARTLRFYESKELLSPIREGQRRLFTKKDRARLKLIMRGKRFGFTLEEMRQLLDLYTKDDNQWSQLTETYKAAQSRLEALTTERNQLSDTISELEQQMQWGQDMLRNMQQECA